jgi:hypothetical protein
MSLSSADEDLLVWLHLFCQKSARDSLPIAAVE